MSDLMDVEHDAWREMFKTFCEVTGLSRDEANSAKYRVLFNRIELWGIQYFLLRESQLKNVTEQQRTQMLRPIIEVDVK